VAAGAASFSNVNHIIHVHLDPAAVSKALEPLTDVTHVFYAS
jgi:hypothetical protein